MEEGKHVAKEKCDTEAHKPPHQEGLGEDAHSQGSHYRYIARNEAPMLGQQNFGDNNTNIMITASPTDKSKNVRQAQETNRLIKGFRSVYAQRYKAMFQDIPPLSLPMQARPDLVPAMTSRTDPVQAYALPAGTTIIQALDQVPSSLGLLILGDQGTGKTTQLLELALEL